MATTIKNALASDEARVDPAHQGIDVGAALMTEALKAVDRDRLIAYLESSNPKNISLYERHGFDLSVKFNLATPLFYGLCCEQLD